MKQQISPLTENERLWVANHLDGARKFVAAYCDGEKALSLAALDRAFAAWMATNETDNDTVNSVINCVGAAFGQCFVERAGLNWVIVNDEHGTELAVHGLPGKGDFLVFPADFVAKRYERRETNFLEALFPQMLEQLESIKANASAYRAKPWWKFW